ncbi:hypothetical protein F2Q68_00020631 [Brassica cretica]|uniref:Uncharacterized protein n=1 Tax=Brassica cretica TaxID=69181 RepID=A0A8S9G3M6_BRACR|nr:hypothetical protein F2Q68_00020631 [Brassica cretica]
MDYWSLEIDLVTRRLYEDPRVAEEPGGIQGFYDRSGDSSWNPEGFYPFSEIILRPLRPYGIPEDLCEYHRTVDKASICIDLRSPPLAGLLAHSAGATRSQLISAQRTVRVSGRWFGSGPVAGCEVRSWGHGPLGLGTRLRAKSRRLRNLRSSMGDREQEKNMENPDTVQKVCGGLWLHQTERTVLVIAPQLCPRDTSLDLAVHNRTASLDTGRLCGWFDLHHGLGGWAKRLVMSQKARVAKGHELPKVVRCQRVGGWLYDLGYGRQELRMVLVKPMGREGSVSERLCNVWLDDAGDELVIVYETVKMLCIGSHVSNQGAADGAGLFGLPTDPVETNTGGVLPNDPANLTGTQQDSQQHQERDEEVESSNATCDGDQREKVADGTANALTALSKEDLIEAMKVMCNQVAAMTQLFTPLVNSLVGQATPVATATPIATSMESKTVLDRTSLVEAAPIGVSQAARKSGEGSWRHKQGVLGQTNHNTKGV